MAFKGLNHFPPSVGELLCKYELLILYMALDRTRLMHLQGTDCPCISRVLHAGISSTPYFDREAAGTSTWRDLIEIWTASPEIKQTHSRPLN